MVKNKELFRLHKLIFILNLKPRNLKVYFQVWSGSGFSWSGFSCSVLGPVYSVVSDQLTSGTYLALSSYHSLLSLHLGIPRYIHILDHFSPQLWPGFQEWSLWRFLQILKVGYMSRTNMEFCIIV